MIKFLECEYLLVILLEVKFLAYIFCLFEVHHEERSKNSYNSYPGFSLVDQYDIYHHVNQGDLYKKKQNHFA